MDIFLEVFNVSGEGISWLFCTRNWGLTWFNQGQMIQLYNGDKSGYLTRISRGYNQKKTWFRHVWKSDMNPEIYAKLKRETRR
jgi:hypothetical protein